jgi:hypothetical protein
MRALVYSFSADVQDRPASVTLPPLRPYNHATLGLARARGPNPWRDSSAKQGDTCNRCDTQR